MCFETINGNSMRTDRDIQTYTFILNNKNYKNTNDGTRDETYFKTYIIMDQDDSGNNQQDYQDISIKLTDNR
jgi:hypothetical protein